MERNEGERRSVSRRGAPRVTDEGDPAEALLKSQSEAFLTLLLVIAEVSPIEKSFLMAYFGHGGGGTEEEHWKALGTKFGISPEEVAKERDRLLQQLRDKAIRFGYRKDDF